MTDMPAAQTESSEESSDEFDDALDQSSASGHDEGPGERLELRLPRIRLLLFRPNLFFIWLLACAEGWFGSRPLGLLLPAAPLLVAVTTCSLMLLKAKRGLEDQALLLQTIVSQPDSEQQPRLHELRLLALAGLQPEKSDPLLRLALFLAKQERFEETVAHMQRLAEWGETGIPEARMWLVRDALSLNPHQQLSSEVIEKHLQKVVQAAPRSIEAHSTLAAILLERGELMLAERSLAAAAELAPRYLLPLIELRRSLGRNNASEDDIRNAIGILKAAIERTPADVEQRVAAARLLMMINDFAAAEKILVDGRSPEDPPILKRVLAEKHTVHAEFLLGSGSLYRDQAASLIAAALTLDPLNFNATEIADRLTRLDAQFPPDLIRSGTAKWEEAFARLPESPDVRLSLCRMLELSGQPERSLELLQPLLRDSPNLSSKAVELLHKSGKQSEARASADALVARAQQTDATSADRRAAAEALLVLGDFAAVRQLLQSDSDSANNNPAEQILFGIACLREFDQLSRRPKLTGPAAEYWIPDFRQLQSEQIDNMLQLLRTAGALDPVRLDAADRLARIALLDHPASAEAELLLMSLRVRENNPAEILNQLGAHAIIHERYAKALTWLEQGNRLSDGKNPAILNNLALCVLRGKSDSPTKALLLVDEALKLLPDNPELLSTRGEIHIAMELWNDAREDLEKSLAARSGRPKVHRLLEQVFTRLRKTNLAEIHRAEAEKLEQAIQNASNVTPLTPVRNDLQ
jgi:tetratricopeptide (TPR) repeat protein